jgi:hypothetical protein
MLESKLGTLRAGHGCARRPVLGGPRESNLSSVLHSTPRLASVTSWQASDATRLPTQSLDAPIPHHAHLQPRSDHRHTFPALDAHCDPSPRCLEVKEQPPAGIQEKEQHHNHVRAPPRARACKADECRKWATQRRLTTTQRHASARRSSAARCLGPAIAAELEPDCTCRFLLSPFTRRLPQASIQLCGVRAHCSRGFWLSRCVKESCPWLYSRITFPFAFYAIPRSIYAHPTVTSLPRPVPNLHALLCTLPAA